jgi:hypothetical protein
VNPQGDDSVELGHFEMLQHFKQPKLAIQRSNQLLVNNDLTRDNLIFGKGAGEDAKEYNISISEGQCSFLISVA